MIGKYSEDLNSMMYRDVAEYATMVVLTQTMRDLTEQGVNVTPALMQKFRDEWTRDGQPMDFTTMKVNPRDFANLLASTGARTYGSIDTTTNAAFEQSLVKVWKDSKAEYEKQAALGNYLHVVTDPEIRSHILDGASTPMMRAFFMREGASARSLSIGDPVTFVDRPEFKGTPLTFTATVQAPVIREGFRDATIPQPKAEAPVVENTPADDIEYDEERLLGWDGGTDKDGRDYRGLSHIFGAYLTKADAELVAKNIDKDQMFPYEIAENGMSLLKHLRANGHDFNVRDLSKRNQIEVRLNAGENVNVRVFDTDKNGAYVGRVYDTYSEYFYNLRMNKNEQAKATFNPNEAIAIIDHVVGTKLGKVKKSISTDTTSIHLPGISTKKELMVKPLEDRYKALIFKDAEEAREFIDMGIDEATEFVDNEFRADELQALLDAGIEDENVLITSPEFQAKLEALYSNDAIVREAQERVAQMAYHSDDNGREYLDSIKSEIVGNYEDGFNPVFVIEHMKETDRGHDRNAMMAALKTVEYDMSKIKGNDFAVNALRERLVTFNPDTAKSIDELEHPMLKNALLTVQQSLSEMQCIGLDGERSKPQVMIDENGIIQWDAHRLTGSGKAELKWQRVSGQIGQVMVPNEHGIIETNFQGGNNYGIVPGFTGYFAFEGDYENRMERFRVKGFEQHLTEQLRATVAHQIARPIIPEFNDIPTTLDASAINGLYHGDVYGKRIEIDFMESNQLSDETKQAILTTLSNRVRFDNQFSDYATTSAETQADREVGAGDDMGAFSYWQAAGGKNMRVLHEDLANYADLTMTGTGKTQGLIWYLTDGAEVNPDGSVNPSKGIIKEDGTFEPDKTALQKLSYFDKKHYNAWDRNQMSANQLMTALKVDENVNTALMAFGGWTFDDSYAVSKEFAERNKVFGNTPNEESMQVLEDLLAHVSEGGDKHEFLKDTGMMWTDDVIQEGIAARDAGLDEDVSFDAYLATNGCFRPLQRGDKLSDFGGNKGTIGIVIDRDMDLDEAKKLKLDKEVRFMKANPQLDVISAPYSMLSRHNAGVVRELMDGNVQDLVDPDTGEVFEAAMGQLNIIVTDMKVDNKTHAYTREDVLEGKGRKASGQLAWALQSKDAKGITNEIYGRNDAAWETYREYLIATGLDMKPDGTVTHGYTPHAGEERNHFEHDPEKSSADFLDAIQDNGGFLDLPFELDFKNGKPTDELPVLSASLRQNVELVDGSMRRSDFTNHYANIYDAVTEYKQAGAVEDEAARKDLQAKAQARAQAQFDKIQSTIIDRQFNGGHNGKHSFIRDKIMGKRMQNSATGVAIVDPRLDIGEAGMNQNMMDALNAKEGDIVMAFRDPVWRDGAIRAMKVVKDDSVHGIAINPIADKSHDMDFDGDTMGIMKFNTKEANDDLINKFSHWANMVDKGNGKNQLYFQTGMDLASAEAKAEKLGDDSPKKLYESAVKNAQSNDPRLLKKACRDLNDYSHKLFREHGFGGDFVSLKDDQAAFDSFEQMVKNGAKGNMEKSFPAYVGYHKGEKTGHDAREIQYATGVKSDDTGLAGAFSQRLVAIMRNQNITAALEAMYPVTQGTLQIKHDATHARQVNGVLTADLPQTFRGQDVDDPKRKLTPKRFKAQLTKVLEKDLKVNVNEEYIDAVTDVLTHKGEILSLKDAMAVKGSPMDRVAYGGGYDELLRIAGKQESLLQGEQCRQFAPFTMRDAQDKVKGHENIKLSKKDTQKPVAKSTEADATTDASREPVAAVATQPAVAVAQQEDAGLAL